jgi:hypothetical protein
MIELSKGNLIETVRGCLEEHRVEIGSGEKSFPFYLIEGRAQSPLFDDFKDTYPEADGFKRRLAEKLTEKSKREQVYGILVDTGMKYSFAFNRKFGDLDRENKRISFKSVEELLIGLTEAKGEDLAEADIFEGITVQIPHKLSDIANLTLRYAVVGGKAGKTQDSGDVKLGEVIGRMSMLDRILRDYSKREIVLRNSEAGEKFFLLNVGYETSRLDDFIKTYEPFGGVDSFKMKVAEKLFGKQKVNNRYGIVFDRDLRMRLAFNTAFAHYDAKRKDILYTPVEDLLLSIDPKKDLSENLGVVPRPIPRPGPPITFRYAIVGKK